MKKSGFAHVGILLVLVVVLLAVPVLNLEVTSRFNGGSAPQVKGVLIAKGGDDSGGSGGSGSSGDSGSRDSGKSSGGSSSGSSGGSSGSSGSSSDSSGGTTTLTPRPTIKTEIKVKKPEKVEKTETKELKTEVEVEDEVEKPEVRKIEIKEVAGHLEIETKNASPGATTTGVSGKTSKLEVQIGQGKTKTKIEIRAKGGSIEVRAKGIGALTNFPLSFDKSTGQLIVNTANGPVPIRVLPDQAASVAQTAGRESLIEKIELTGTATGSAEPVAFKIKGTRIGNLLGLLPVSASVETQVGAQTGQILSTTEPLWLRLFGALVR